METFHQWNCSSIYTEQGNLPGPQVRLPNQVDSRRAATTRSRHHRHQPGRRANRAGLAESAAHLSKNPYTIVHRWVY